MCARPASFNGRSGTHPHCLTYRRVDAPEDRLLTVTEVADYLRVDPESIRRWLREGRVRGINLGRAAGWRIRVGDLSAFIDARHTKAGQPPLDLREDEDHPAHLDDGALTT